VEIAADELRECARKARSVTEAGATASNGPEQVAKMAPRY